VVSGWRVVAVQPGSQSDIFRHIFPSHLQSSRQQKTDTDVGHDVSDTDVDTNDGDRDDKLTDTEVQHPPADQVDGPSSSGGGGTEPSDKQPSKSSLSSSDGSGTDVGQVPPPKTASVSDKGDDGSSSSSTRPRQPDSGRRPVTKCHSVPVVYSGETVVRLGQICYQVPRDGS